jgi:hypothetical protein
LIKYPYPECPRFKKCSVNNCPLHPSFPELFIDPNDFQVKCKLEKEVRFRIGSKYPGILKYQGLTPQEWAGKKRFESLTKQDKQIVQERAKRAILSACGTEVLLEGTRLPASQVGGEKTPIIRVT